MQSWKTTDGTMVSMWTHHAWNNFMAHAQKNSLHATKKKNVCNKRVQTYVAGIGMQNCDVAITAGSRPDPIWPSKQWGPHLQIEPACLGKVVHASDEKAKSKPGRNRKTRKIKITQKQELAHWKQNDICHMHSDYAHSCPINLLPPESA